MWASVIVILQLWLLVCKATGRQEGDAKREQYESAPEARHGDARSVAVSCCPGRRRLDAWDRSAIHLQYRPIMS